MHSRRPRARHSRSGSVQGSPQIRQPFFSHTVALMQQSLGRRCDQPFSLAVSLPDAGLGLQVQVLKTFPRCSRFARKRRVANLTSSQMENNYFTEMCSGSEAGSCVRLIDFVYHSTPPHTLSRSLSRYRTGGRVSRTASAHKPVRPRHCEGARATTKIGTGNLSRWTRAPRPGPAHCALRFTRFNKLRAGGARELRQSPVSGSHVSLTRRKHEEVVGGVGRERRDLRSARRQDGRGCVIKWRGDTLRRQLVGLRPPRTDQVEGGIRGRRLAGLRPARSTAFRMALGRRDGRLPRARATGRSSSRGVAARRSSLVGYVLSAVGVCQAHLSERRSAGGVCHAS